MARERITYSEADKIALEWGIRVYNVRMFDEKTLNMFGTEYVEVDRDKRELIVYNNKDGQGLTEYVYPAEK